MKNGKIASQVSHLARTMTRTIFSHDVDTDIMKKYNNWITTGSHIIVLNVSESEIQKLALNPNSCVIVDEGHTQVEPNSLTIMGFYPSALNPEFKSYSNVTSKPKTTQCETIYQQSMHDISISTDISDLSIPMYFLVNKTYEVTKYKLITQIFHITMEMTKFVMHRPDNDPYLTIFTDWINKGAKTIVLKVDNEQISKVRELNMSHKLFNAREIHLIPSIVGFLPHTVDSSTLSSYKLY